MTLPMQNGVKESGCWPAFAQGHTLKGKSGGRNKRKAQRRTRRAYHQRGVEVESFKN